MEVIDLKRTILGAGGFLGSQGLSTLITSHGCSTLDIYET
jgi:hypothetical protein